MQAIDNIKRFLRIVSTSSIDASEQYSRLKLMERDIGVPVKMAVLGLMAYFLFFTDFEEGRDFILRARVKVALEPVQAFFLGYVVQSVFSLPSIDGSYVWFNGVLWL